MAQRYVLGMAILVTVLLQGSESNAADKDAIRRAVDRGVLRLRQLQAADGSWPTHHVGATALVGLTLLECDVPATDAAVQKAAEYLRATWTEIDDRHATYALSLTILFFDRLGDPADFLIIQAAAIRLLGGQNMEGGWSYACPPLGPEDLRQLKSSFKQQVELKAKGDSSLPPARNPSSKPAFPKEIQQILTRMAQKSAAQPGRADARRGAGGDNSNTQFAILGLWAARRHGIPVEKALARTAIRFRGSQHVDGGWGYSFFSKAPKVSAATPAMTCAGLLGLGLGYGSAREAVLRTDPRLTTAKVASPKAPPDLVRDPAIRAGFAYLAHVIGQPLPDAAPGGAGDKYYLLWSVERVAVAYGLPTIGNKDWYDWGSQILLGAQEEDGGWRGKFGTDVDSSFALLFLRRANLSRDLTGYLKGSGSLEVALKTGGLKEAAVRSDGTGKPSRAKAPEAVGPEAGKASAEKSVPSPGGKRTEGSGDQLVKVSPVPLLPVAGNADAARLGGELVKASGSQQEQLLNQIKEAKGAAYTEALAGAIPQLSGAAKTKARDALAERLARMTGATLRDRLRDEASEIRRAAALACAVKADAQLVPDLAPLLEDSQPAVVRAAHAALKDLTGQDLGPAADAPPAARSQAVAAWKEWWKKQSGK